MIIDAPALVSHCATDGDVTPVHDVREMVLGLEAKMLERPQVAIETTHYFVPGVYARQIVIPKGVLATSKIHLFEHLSIVPQGDISVLTPQGVKRIHGPCVFVGQPGAKLLGYAHEDTVWISIERCEATEPEKAELELVAETYEEFMKRTNLLEGDKAWPSLPPQSSAE